MGTQIENRQIIVNIVADDVQKAQETLLKKQKALNDEIKKTNDPKALKDYKQQLDQVNAALNRNEKVLKGELLPTYNQLTAAVKKYYAEFKKTGDPAVLKKYTEANALLKQQKAEIAALEKQASGLTKTSFFQASFWGNLAAQGVARLSSAIGSFFRGAVDEALNADEATQRLQATLSNLGRSDAFDRIARQADTLAQKFRYLDNDDIVAVFNKLIDYGKLTEKEMNNLLPVIIDFAAKSKLSIGDSADVIIKALGGNAKALKEYGIDIKDAGSETERLNIIMTTLKQKVDGSGEAFQNSAKGGIAVARQELNNLKEDIGKELIPILNSLLGWLVDAIKGLKTFFKNARDGFKEGFSNAGRSFISVIKELAGKEINESIRKQLVDTLQNVNDTIASETDKQKLGINSKDTPADKAKKEEKAIKDLLTPLERLLRLRKQINEELQKGNTDEIEKRLQAEAALIKAGGLLRNKDFTGIDPATRNALFSRDRLAANELAVLTSRGKARLAAEKKLLDEQERQELEKKDLTEHEKLLIEEKYRQARKKKEKDFLLGLIESIIQYTTEAVNILSTFSQAKSNIENAELDRDRRNNDKKISNLERRLRSGLISQKEYDRQVQQIQDQQERRAAQIEKRQFERNRRISIIQALINGAEGITKTIAQNGFPKAIPFLILQAAQIAASIALINSQKPKFARGGKLGGRTHSQGGNAITDGAGNKIGEIEEGEGIINRRSMADRRQYTLSGTPSQIASQVNGLHGGVQWERPRYLNYGAINSRYYAQGGQFEATAGAQPNTGELTSAVKTLNYILLNQGIQVSVSRINTAQDRLAAIRADATIK